MYASPYLHSHIARKGQGNLLAQASQHRQARQARALTRAPRPAQSAEGGQRRPCAPCCGHAPRPLHELSRAGERPTVCVSDSGGFHGVGIRPSK